MLERETEGAKARAEGKYRGMALRLCRPTSPAPKV
jgi:hypothetical protein